MLETLKKIAFNCSLISFLLLCF